MISFVMKGVGIMGPIKETRGRPPNGLSTMDKERKIRLSSELDVNLRVACRLEGISVAEGMRIAIRMYIAEVFKRHGGNDLW